MIGDDTKNGRSPSLARFSLKQAVLFNLLFFLLIFAGILVVQIMPVDVYPDVDLDEATIDTFWPGASAEDIERLITDRIEEEIVDIRGISRIISDSKSDASFIRVKFREDLSDTALDASFRELRAAVDRVPDLPEDAEEPRVTRISLAEIFPLLWVVVEDIGGVGEDALHEVALKLKPILRDVRGVAKVDDKLIRDRELHIRIDRQRLREADLTLDEVVAVLKQYNRNIPSGTIEHNRGEYAVRAMGEAINPDELGDIAVRKLPSGSHVHLRDIATIERSFQRKRFFARYLGHECKALSIAKTDESDSRQVSDGVRAAISDFKKTLPAGINVATCLDASDIIRSRMRILLTNLSSGIGLVFLCLWAAMGVRNSFLAILGIPFAFLCSLIFMHLIGVTINAVSLFALVLCSGMIVDDAIVVLENIYRHIEINERRTDLRGSAAKLHDAIVSGVDEVLWPVVSSSATTVVAFLPMLIMTGVTGEFFSIIPKTVAVVLVASLVECLVMIPVHYHTMGPRKRIRAITPTQEDSTIGDAPHAGLFTPLVKLYEMILVGSLRHRYLAPLPLLGAGFVAYAVAPLLPVDLFPSDYQLVEIDIKIWDEASLDQTAKVVAPIEKLILDMGDEYIQSMLASFGIIATVDNSVLWRNNMAQLHVQLADTPTVNADPDLVSALILRKIGDYVEANPDCGIRHFNVWAPQDGPPIGKPVGIRIESPNLSIAKRLAEKYKHRLAQIDGVYGVSDDLDFGPKQIDLRLNEDIASAHGLTQPRLASALRTANDGVIVSTFKDVKSGEDQDVRLLLDRPYRRDLNDLLDVRIRAPGGYPLEIRDIATVDMSQGYANIPHYNGKRVVTVNAQIDTSRTTAHYVNGLVERDFAPLLAQTSDARVTYGGEFEETTRSFDSLKRAYFIAFVLVYMLLATQFKSYSQPFVVMFTVPFACVGVVAGLFLGDYPFTIMTFIAIVGLTGVVVNDSIVLLDFVNRHMRIGKPPVEAIRDACLLRLRPVMLTTITTVLGLLPLAMGWGGRSKIWSPFASSFAWGLAFSTAVTLIIEPTLYLIAHQVVSAVRGRRPEEIESDTSPTAAIPHAK